MPTGYSAGTPETESSPEPADSSSVGASSPECERLFNQFDEASASGQGQASIAFRKSPTGPFIRHTLESYRDASALQASMTKIREAVDKCGEFSVGDAGGYLVAVRIANVVSTIISFGVPSAEAAETEQIARKAVDKATPLAR